MPPAAESLASGGGTPAGAPPSAERQTIPPAGRALASGGGTPTRARRWTDREPVLLEPARFDPAPFPPAAPFVSAVFGLGMLRRPFPPSSRRPGTPAGSVRCRRGSTPRGGPRRSRALRPPRR